MKEILRKVEEIRNKIKEIQKCQKNDLENLESKFENALQEDMREIEEKLKEIKNQQNVGERRETIIHKIQQSQVNKELQNEWESQRKCTHYKSKTTQNICDAIIHPNN
ncbi:unnamed protein product [Diabrotica balteata]|uniref:Uncharacterized protein n=1 Tax=Diabrotica balteata TaxID=107213 RepID=A0A9N9SSP0_DIABA|nr:unnamed protein product [Diabrotica balteata]